MLPSEVTGIQQPSSMALEYIKNGDIKALSKVIIYRRINNTEVPTEVNNVVNYEITEDRRFGAASLILDVTNENGLYSYSNRDSRYNYVTAYTDNTYSIPFQGGVFEDTAYIGGKLTLRSGAEEGAWTSAVISPAGVKDWFTVRWEADIEPVSSWRIASTPLIEIYARFGNTSTPDDSWTPWKMIERITGKRSDQFSYANFFSEQTYDSSKNAVRRFLQFKLVFKAGKQLSSVFFPKLFPPKINWLSVTYATGDSGLVFSPLYYYGNKIEVYEAIVSPDESFIEWHRAFKGFLDEIVPAQTGEGFDMTCVAFDMMKICLNGIIEKPNPNIEGDTAFEARKFGKPGTNEPLTLELIKIEAPGWDFNGDGKIDVPVDEDEVGSVFRIPDEFRQNGPIRGFEHTPGYLGQRAGDRKYVPWASRPKPIISLNAKPKFDGYQIDYSRGVVYFGEIIKEDDLPVTASFYWYDLEDNLFEDVLGEIIARAIEDFGYEKSTRKRFDDYDVWSSPNHDIKIILERSKPRVTVPPLGFYLDDGKTYFDAINEVLKFTSPDYVLRATPEGNFVGEYLPQKSVPDYTLELITELEAPVSQEEVYTRCIAQGVEPFTRNIAGSDAEITFPVLEPNYSLQGLNGYDKKHLVDGDIDNNVGWCWQEEKSKKVKPEYYGPPGLPMEMVRFTFAKPIKIGAINILVGNGVGPPPDGAFNGTEYGPVNMSGFGVAVEVSNDGQYWLPITDGDFRASTGEWIQIEKSSMMSDIVGTPFRMVRILATNTPSGERGSTGIFWGLIGKTNYMVWNWALREVQIFPDETIRGEATVKDLADEGSIPHEVAEDILRRIGNKTIVLPVDATLQDESMVRARALDYLYEVCRNLYTSTANVVYAPHVRVGHTVYVVNDKIVEAEGNKVGRAYYVDGVTRRMQGGSPSVTLNLVSWI